MLEVKFPPEPYHVAVLQDIDLLSVVAENRFI